jgi:alkylmercury lyase
MLASWAGWGNAYFDNEHRVIAAWGLGLYETGHRFIVNGHTLYTWCALDTFYLADLLRVTARVESVCPITKEKVSFTVRPEGVNDIAPANAMVSVLVPDGVISTDVRLSFCHFVNFFSSAEAGSKWIAEQPGTFRLLTVEGASSLMRLVTRAFFHHVMSARSHR